MIFNKFILNYCGKQYEEKIDKLKTDVMQEIKYGDNYLKVWSKIEYDDNYPFTREEKRILKSYIDNE